MKTAIVTGASSGTGRAVNTASVARGYRVFGTSRDSSTVADPVPGVANRDLDLTGRGSISLFIPVSIATGLSGRRTRYVCRAVRVFDGRKDRTVGLLYNTANRPFHILVTAAIATAIASCSPLSADDARARD